MMDRAWAQNETYAYASGRIRALEKNLLDTARYNRLFEARSVEDVSRVLTESGYPQADHPESSLSQESVQVYHLIMELIPDSLYTEALLLPHDVHNLKVILKTLSPWWPQPSEAPDAGALPDDTTQSSLELPAVDEALQKSGRDDLASIRHLLLQPSLIPVNDLYQSMVQRRSDLIPAWAYQAAIDAVAVYLSSYDISDIDRILERHAYREISERVRRTKDSFFIDYHRKKVDLINISMLLRLRLRREKERVFTGMMLDFGRLSQDTLRQWFSASPEVLTAQMQKGPYPSLADFSESYGQAGSAARLGLESDHILMEHVQKVRWVLNGPQIPIAYLWSRELEMKNVRIALACIRNNLKMEQARELARKRYWDWR